MANLLNKRLNIPYSQIIYANLRRMINVETKKEGKHLSDVLDGENRYILLEGTNSCFYGYYAEYVENRDSLIFVVLTFYCNMLKWKERGRIVFSRDGAKVTGSVFPFLQSIDSIFDVTGSTYRNTHIPGQSAEAIRRFFGPVWHKNSPMTFSCDCDIRYLLTEKDKIMFKKPLISYNMGDNELRPLNIEAKKRVTRMFAKLLAEKKNSVSDILKDGFSFAYLYKSTDRHVADCYVAMVKNINKGGKMTIGFYNYARIGITDADSFDGIRNSMLVNVPLLFYEKEGIASGAFQYAEKMLHLMANKAKKMCDSPALSCSLVDETLAKGNRLWILLALLKNPLYEKIMNSQYERLKSVMGSLINNGFDGFMVNCPFPEMADIMKNKIEGTFGEIDYTKGPLAQMLGIPPYMLQQLGNNKELKSAPLTIKMIKKMYESNPEYLKHMNKKAIDSLLACIRTSTNKKMYIKNSNIDVIQKIAVIYGVQNMENYIRFCIKNNSSTYSAYINIIYNMKDDVKGFDWKLKGAALRTSYDTIMPEYEMYQNKETYEKYQRKYEKLGESVWKKYEFEDNNFLITYPKRPIDVVVEGVKLNHCAKRFMEPVGDGFTTILFIRKKQRPDVPFYTLEIRNGRIRQCHGKNNVNTSKNPKLQNFLKKFCEKYDINYNEGEKMLAV